MKIGLVGCGNMGSALVEGIKKTYKSKIEIFAYDIDSKKLEGLVARCNVVKANGEKEIAEKCDIMILAVKPADIESVVKKISEKDSEDKIIVSIAAGIRVSLFRKYFAKSLIARVMPNIAFLAGEGVSAIYFDGNFSEEQKKSIMDIFNSCGISEEIRKEDLLDTVTGLSGSGPAFAFVFMNALSDAGVMEGLPRETARRLAIQTVKGAATLAEVSLKENIHLEELKDRVTSPAGTTAEGLMILEEGNFRALVIKAVRGAVKRAKELGLK